MNLECCGMKCPQTPPVENTAVYDRFFFNSSKPQRKMMATWATARWTPAPRRGRTSTTSSTCPCGAWPRRRWRSCSNRGTRRSLLFLSLPFFNVFFYCRSFLFISLFLLWPKEHEQNTFMVLFVGGCVLINEADSCKCPGGRAERPSEEITRWTVEGGPGSIYRGAGCEFAKAAQMLLQALQ